MVRKLALAVSLALGTVSVPVHALGLGDLDSKSTLNQNFRGDITLLSVPPEELDGVRVKLADTEAFEFQQIYSLEVMVIPTHLSVARKDHGDLIFLTQEEKFNAIVDDILRDIE